MMVSALIRGCGDDAGVVTIVGVQICVCGDDNGGR